MFVVVVLSSVSVVRNVPGIFFVGGLLGLRPCAAFGAHTGTLVTNVLDEGHGEGFASLDLGSTGGGRWLGLEG